MPTNADNENTPAQNPSARASKDAWLQRARDCAAYAGTDLAQAIQIIVATYEQLLQSGESEPPVLVKANFLRKRIEAAEQHRTMSAEHGLGNEAIDVTYEIHELENELVSLIQKWEK